MLTEIIATLSTAGATSFYCYRVHMYNRLMWGRMNWLYENKIPFSGVLIKSRQAFGWLGPFQWLFPHHHSLVIKNPRTGKIRHVGLGPLAGQTGLIKRRSGWVYHVGSKYKWLNKFDVSIPIEAWPDLYFRLGTWIDPTKINHDLLDIITRTHDDPDFDSIPLLDVNFGSIAQDAGNRTGIVTCQFVVMDALLKEIKLLEWYEQKHD